MPSKHLSCGCLVVPLVVVVLIVVEVVDTGVVVSRVDVGVCCVVVSSVVEGVASRKIQG